MNIAPFNTQLKHHTWEGFPKDLFWVPIALYMFLYKGKDDIMWMSSAVQLLPSLSIECLEGRDHVLVILYL